MISLLLTATLFFSPWAHAFMPTSTPRPHRSSSAALHAYQKVFVAGGSRGVGKCVIDQLLAQNIQVVALIRDPALAESLNAVPGLTAVVGDAAVIKDVENAMDGCDAAITTLAGKTDDQYMDYVGNNHVIESAGILGVTRVVLVTSIGCGSSREAAPPAVLETLKDVLAQKEKAENILIKYYTNMDWTIIRPGGLKSEPATKQAILTEDTTAIGSIHREDVADLIVRALDSDACTRKVLSAIDPSVEANVKSDAPIEAFVLN